MSNLQFFKGLQKDLPDNKNLLEKESFYLTEQEYNFYYSNSIKDLELLFANPSKRLKELHTYYSTTSNQKPVEYPPPSDIWFIEEPEDILIDSGVPLYSVTCKVYGDGNFSYSAVQETITFADIDNICNNIDNSQSIINNNVIGQMVLNTK